ncbi:MAG: rhomboid family intramembrane serine protease [bacterium]|nr:rhomboid family intramembrane serine protease [bacterium]
MVIILPVSHENMQAQRFPHVTLGLVLLNAFLFIITLIVSPATQEARIQAESRLAEYYMNRLYLDFPDESYLKLNPQTRYYLDRAKEIGMGEALDEVSRNTALADNVLESFQEGSLNVEDEKEAAELLRLKEQNSLNTFIREFEAAYDDDFYIKYGYIPSRGGVLTIFSSIFLHGGFFHLLFNMLFLWLSGCNIEDLWGRIVYPVFYLLGGILATLAHGMMYPESPIPLIGASGAIAAVMGAFMIRMYATKIYFVYLILAFGLMRGRFSAPAYVMLPLWLLQQLWGVFFHGGASGTAFWAHIGGFIFGAVAASLMKVSGFESNILAPALEKKTAIIDEHLVNGIEKLRANDIDGAIQDLKTAMRNNSDDPTVHCELSKAYFAKGSKTSALREFKRAIFLYMKRGDMEDAVEQYLELHEEMPQMMLDPPQQKKLAAALEKFSKGETAKYADAEEGREQQRLMYQQAAFAYKQIVAHYHKKAANPNHPDAMMALRKYGNLHLEHIRNPKEAIKAYKALLRSTHLSAEDTQQIEASIQQAVQDIAREAEEAKQKEIEKAKHAQQRLTKADNSAAQKKALAGIPIQKRVKLFSAVDGPAKYHVPSVAPLEANKVLPTADGLDLKRLNEPTIVFDEIYLICVCRLTERPAPKPSSRGLRKKKKDTSPPSSDKGKDTLIADLYLGGHSRPYRLASDQIAYTKFFSSNLQANSLDNFRQFIQFIILQLSSVHVDRYTMDYLKNGKVHIFSSQDSIAIHQKILWKQLRGVVRIVCGRCVETYWIDGQKIPEQGATSKCTKCGHPISIRRLKAS